jgi:adenylate cyclase
LSDARVVRRLAAVLAADVAGYSRLMGRDESGTLSLLKAHRTERLEPALARHGGRLVKLTGDGALAEFGSAVEAVSAAIDFQQAMIEANRDQPHDSAMRFRIGVHLGDLIVDGDDLYGDGVNVAARLESEAPAGGIVISRSVHDAVVGRLKASFDDRGELALKNIERPVQAFAVRWDAADWATQAPAPHAATPRAHVPLVLPDKPSIAVLPFTNMSGDPEQGYFTDGVTEDIITELSRFRSLFVIARNSSFSYRGKSPDIRQVGRELGVRYVVEGSIRKAANRIRVTGQLIDASTGAHIWAERYDRVIEDIFEVQEELTRSIVAAIAPEIELAEQEKLRRRRPESLGAYEIAVRAWAKAWDAFGRADIGLRDEAIGDARAALAVDARSSIALNALALAQWQHLAQETAADPQAAWRDGMQAAAQAVAVDRSDSNAYAAQARLLVFAFDRDRIDEALVSARQAHALNPHNMIALVALAYVENVTGSPHSAIEHLHQALRISPRDPVRYLMHLQLAVASICSGQYEDGVTYASMGIGVVPGFPLLHSMRAISHVGMGDIAAAKAALEDVRRVAPSFVERRLRNGFPYRNPAYRQRMMTFFRIAAGVEDASAAEPLR